MNLPILIKINILKIFFVFFENHLGINGKAPKSYTELIHKNTITIPIKQYVDLQKPSCSYLRNCIYTSKLSNPLIVSTTIGRVSMDPGVNL